MARGTRATTALGGLAFVAVASGCCTSLRDAETINAKLRLQNIARAEPAMQRAAQANRARLLPVHARWFGLIPGCETKTAANAGFCVLASSNDVHQLRDPQGAVSTAVSIRPHERSTARLARRGEGFVIFLPQVTARRTGARTQCECDRSPHVISMTGFVNLEYAFALDGTPPASLDVEVARVTVPVVEDYIEWECEMGLL